MSRSYTNHHGHTYPYYKVQYWDKRSFCWMDVQKVSYKTQKEAEDNFIDNKKCRVMIVEEKRRYPIEKE
jgi:hypothetical protein